MEDLVPMVPVVPSPRKMLRARVARDEIVKKPRGKPPKKPLSMKPTVRRATVVTENNSGGEIDGFTDLDDPEGEVGCRLPKPTPVRQRK